MTKRKKIEILDTLKAEDFKDKEDGSLVLTGNIIQVRDVQTKHGEKMVVSIEPTSEGMTESLNLFCNMDSQNNLIDSFGEDDSNWIGKSIKVVKETDKNFNQEKLVCLANTEKF